MKARYWNFSHSEIMIFKLALNKDKHSRFKFVFGVDASSRMGDFFISKPQNNAQVPILNPRTWKRDIETACTPKSRFSRLCSIMTSIRESNLCLESMRASECEIFLFRRMRMQVLILNPRIWKRNIETSRASKSWFSRLCLIRTRIRESNACSKLTQAWECEIFWFRSPRMQVMILNPRTWKRDHETSCTPKSGLSSLCLI